MFVFMQSYWCLSLPSEGTFSHATQFVAALGNKLQCEASFTLPSTACTGTSTSDEVLCSGIFLSCTPLQRTLSCSAPYIILCSHSAAKTELNFVSTVAGHTNTKGAKHQLSVHDKMKLADCLFNSVTALFGDSLKYKINRVHKFAHTNIGNY